MHRPRSTPSLNPRASSLPLHRLLQLQLLASPRTEAPATAHSPTHTANPSPRQPLSTNPNPPLPTSTPQQAHPASASAAGPPNPKPAPHPTNAASTPAAHSPAPHPDHAASHPIPLSHSTSTSSSTSQQVADPSAPLNPTPSPSSNAAPAPLADQAPEASPRPATQQPDQQPAPDQQLPGTREAGNLSASSSLTAPTSTTTAAAAASNTTTTASAAEAATAAPVAYVPLGVQGAFEAAPVQLLADDWESDPADPGRAQVAEGWGHEEGDAPLAAVMEALVGGAVRAQYRLVTRACWSLLLQEHRLLDVIDALRRYFFMAAGDFAHLFTTRLEHELITAPLSSPLAAAAPSATPLPPAAAALSPPATPAATPLAPALSPGRVRGILEDSLRESSCAADPFARLLSVLVVSERAVGPDRAAVPAAAITATDVVQLQMQVAWPLDLVIDPEAQRHYTAVFTMLLRLRRASLSLHRTWALLTQPTRHARRAPRAPLASARLRAVRQWQQQVLQLVVCLQRYVQAALLGDLAAELRAALTAQPLSVAEMRHAHRKYLKQAYVVCFCLDPASEDDRTFRALVLACLGRSWTLQTLITAAFAAHTPPTPRTSGPGTHPARPGAPADVHPSRERPDVDGLGGLAWVLDDDHWAGVSKAYEAVHRKVMELYRYLAVAVVQGGHLADLWAHFDCEFYRREAQRLATRH